MKRMAMILLLVAMLTSCGESEPFVEYNGRLLSEEELVAMREKLLEASQPSDETLHEPADGIVYWTEGGEVWHESASCGHLSQKNPAKTGTVEEAMAAKKERPCSYCCESIK